MRISGYPAIRLPMLSPLHAPKITNFAPKFKNSTYPSVNHHIT